jgi:UDP-N-acetylglucosamine--N-acetylmuramyl-(pentapeptide) pyrophosphoryl-undecaprenol N-acetylglucosamine transferase
MFNFKPDAVVGFGTLDSFPLLMLGRLLRAKTLIHEQNVMPGRANRLLARFADRTAVSFAQTKKYLGIRPERIVYTGNPVREELVKIEKAEARIFFGLNPEKFTILVLGGSQGSRSINLRFLEALQGLTGTYSLQVIHLAGDSDGPGLEEKYRNLKLEARVFSFLNQMQYAYSACDIAICRCGATTLAELIHYRLPAILIPYPYAYNHQRWNADVLEEVGAGAIIEEDKLHTDLLALTVKSFLDDPKKLEKMRACYGKLKDVNANQLLAETVISLVNGGPEMASGVA